MLTNLKSIFASAVVYIHTAQFHHATFQEKGAIFSSWFSVLLAGLGNTSLPDFGRNGAAKLYLEGKQRNLTAYGSWLPAQRAFLHLYRDTMQRHRRAGNWERYTRETIGHITLLLLHLLRYSLAKHGYIYFNLEPSHISWIRTGLKNILTLLFQNDSVNIHKQIA